MQRKKNVKYWPVVLLGGALLVIGLAQGVASAQLPGSTLGPAQAGSADGTDKLSQASTYITRLEQVRSRVQRQLEEARRRNDVVKTLCLNDKLNQLDVALRSASERRRALQQAVSRGDAELANHEFTILTVLHQRTQQLDVEANQCVGKEVGFVGESSVSVEVDVALPADDPSDYLPTMIIVQPPDCASCYM